MKIFQYCSRYNISTSEVIDFLKLVSTKKFSFGSEIPDDFLEILNEQFIDKINYSNNALEKFYKFASAFPSLKDEKYLTPEIKRKRVKISRLFLSAKLPKQNENVLTIDYGSLVKETFNSLGILHSFLTNDIAYVNASLMKTFTHSSIYSNSDPTWFWYTFEETSYGKVVKDLYSKIEKVPYNLLREYSFHLLNYLKMFKGPVKNNYLKPLIINLFYNLKSGDLKSIESDIPFTHYWFNVYDKLPEWVVAISEILLPQTKLEELNEKRKKLLKEYSDNEKEDAAKKQKELEEIRNHKKAELRKKLANTGISFIFDSWGRVLYFYEGCYGGWLPHEYVKNEIKNKN